MVRDDCPPEPTLSFTQGFIVGQISVVLLVAAFIRFFIFGDPPSAEAVASQRADERRLYTEAHKTSLLTLRGTQNDGQSQSQQQTLPFSHPHHPSRRNKSSVLRRPPALTIGSILTKTYYRVESHQPESLDWFNVLIAQAVAQFRDDAQHDDAILTSLTKALNGTSRPDFLDEIRVTELSLGEDFPIFSNCRIIPVDEDGLGLKHRNGCTGGDGGNDGSGGYGGVGGTGGISCGPGPGPAPGPGLGAGSVTGATRLQARMDVDLSDMITLAIETKLLLNYPRRLAAILPVALAVSVVRFSGTLSVSFVPGNPSQDTPTKMIFAFLDDYRLDFSIRSLLGSRSRLQDVPKIAQLIESRLHRWFDDRAVEPRFQEIELPSLWPRMKNARGGSGAAAAGQQPHGLTGEDGSTCMSASVPPAPNGGIDALRQSRPESRDSRESAWDSRRETETETWVERQQAAGSPQVHPVVPMASSLPPHLYRLSQQHQQQETLRYRRTRSRQDDAFSMPGSLPDLAMDPHG